MRSILSPLSLAAALWLTGCPEQNSGPPGSGQSGGLLPAPTVPAPIGAGPPTGTIPPNGTLDPNGTLAPNGALPPNGTVQVPAPDPTKQLPEPAARQPEQPEIAPGRMPPPIQPLNETQRTESGRVAPAAPNP